MCILNVASRKCAIKDMSYVLCLAIRAVLDRMRALVQTFPFSFRLTSFLGALPPLSCLHLFQMLAGMMVLALSAQSLCITAIVRAHVYLPSIPSHLPATLCPGSETCQDHSFPSHSMHLQHYCFWDPLSLLKPMCPLTAPGQCF